MKIAFVHPSYPQGEGTGATHSASQIVSGLIERDHDVTVYCTQHPPAQQEVDHDAALEPLDLSGYPYHSSHQLNQALRRRIDDFDDYDITHSYLMDSIPAMGDIASRTSTSTVVTLNAYGGVCPKNDLRYLNKEACTSNGIAKCTVCSIATSGGHDEYSSVYRSVGRLASLKLIREGERKAGQIDGYHALSTHVKATYVDFDFPADRISTIPNILDERFCRDHIGDFEEPYELLYVGSLDKRKGVDKLVPILDLLNRRSPSTFRLTIVGEGELLSDLKQQARTHEIDSMVSFTGQLPNEDLPKEFASHDLFLYPGRWDEPFGRVFLESLATGTPVVASDVGSIANIIADGGKTTSGSVDEFATSIMEIIEENNLIELSNNAKRQAAQYQSGVVLPKFIGLYEQVM